MWWECSECGHRLEAEFRPTVCPCCGTAGPIFVEAEHWLEGATEAESPQEAWLQFGLDYAERHHPHGAS
jgi:hypothetical protein